MSSLPMHPPSSNNYVQTRRNKKPAKILHRSRPLYLSTVYRVLTYWSRDQNAGRIQSVRIDNSTFERVEEFKYLGTTLTNQNSIVEEIKSRLRSGNACYPKI